jgi:hypothetical protein
MRLWERDHAAEAAERRLDMTTAAEWLAAFADEIGVATPTKEQMDEVLSLAGTAAHASERIAAPIACYLTGTSGRSLQEAIAVAEGLAPKG